MKKALLLSLLSVFLLPAIGQAECNCKKDCCKESCECGTECGDDCKEGTCDQDGRECGCADKE